MVGAFRPGEVCDPEQRLWPLLASLLRRSLSHKPLGEGWLPAGSRAWSLSCPRACHLTFPTWFPAISAERRGEGRHIAGRWMQPIVSPDCCSGLSCGPQKICPLRTCEYDLVWTEGLCRCDQLRIWKLDLPRLEWALNREKEVRIREHTHGRRPYDNRGRAGGMPHKPRNAWSPRGRGTAWPCCVLLPGCCPPEL